MSQDTAQIRKVQDKEGTQFFPITHVDAVIDENGDAVSTLLAGKQATLVSGTNIKTINNESLLGSGNISVSGGGGGTVTSVAMTVPTGLSISGSPVTSSGTLAVSLATGYSIPTTSKQDSWDAKGTYSKPSGGIPATDLASAVQTSLGKADTALQSYTETDPVFTASASAGITTTDISAWNAKLSGVTFNGAAATVTDGVAAITATIPAAPGTLQTNLTTAQTASASEALSGSIKLHKIAKTGTYSDLIGTPTIPTKVSELTNDAGYTTNTGTVTRVDVGTSQYSPASGIVSLPAYPTTLPASDVSAWAKESSKPSYTLDEVSDGSTRKLTDYLPLTGGTLSKNDTPLNLKGGSDSTRLAFYTSDGTLKSYVMYGWSRMYMTYGQRQIGINASNAYYTDDNGTTQYVVYHSGNANKSDVAWACSTLTTSGNVSIDGTTTHYSWIRLPAGNNINSIYGGYVYGLLELSSDGKNMFGRGSTSQGARPTQLFGDTFVFFNKNITNIGSLDNSGNLTVSGTVTPGSDARIKNKQKDISKEDAYSVLEKLLPKTWVWNEKAGEDMNGNSGAGLIAQEVKEVIPDAVTISEMAGLKDFHSLNYNTIQGYEIAAIKGLIEEVKSLKAEIAELKKQIK